MASKISPLEIEELAIAAVMNPYSTLPTAGNRMWEERYERNLALGESKKGAAIHAWMHVKHYYVQDPVTKKWRKRKKPLPFKSKKRVANSQVFKIKNPKNTVADIPEGFAVYVSSVSGFVVFSLHDRTVGWPMEDSGRRGMIGHVGIAPNTRCDVYEVRAADARSGWGPFLYDVAMEWATINSKGLMSDREDVSKEAVAVWRYYLGRPDIAVKPLPSSCPRFQGGKTEVAILDHVFTKPLSTTIDDLKERGLWVSSLKTKSSKTRVNPRRKKQSKQKVSVRSLVSKALR